MKTPIKATQPEKGANVAEKDQTELPWRGGWMNIYRDAALKLGWTCSWRGGKLALSKPSRNEWQFFYFTPENKTFRMEDYIRLAEKELGVAPRRANRRNGTSAITYFPF